MAAIWPDSAELGFAASLGYLGYTGRAADVVATAARDPKAVLASRDDGRFWLTTNMKHVPVASLVRGFYTQMSFAGNSLDRSTFGPDVREGDSQECGHAIQCHGSPARLGRPLKYDIDFRLNGCLCDIAHIDAFSFCPPQGTNRQKRVSRGDVRSINARRFESAMVSFFGGYSGISATCGQWTVRRRDQLSSVGMCSAFGMSIRRGAGLCANGPIQVGANAGRDQGSRTRTPE